MNLLFNLRHMLHVFLDADFFKENKLHTLGDKLLIYFHIYLHTFIHICIHLYIYLVYAHIFLVFCHLTKGLPHDKWRQSYTLVFLVALQRTLWRKG